VKQAKVLIAGDALNIEEGRLIGPRPQFTADMDSALRSLKKLARYDIESVICYHGGLYSGDANQRIAGLAKGGSAEMPTRQG
jgi:glyoxylase-like metal-dependent hydrolase (beta-lactamase superfamily II)